MAYELHFCTNMGTPPEPAEFLAFLKGSDGFRVSMEDGGKFTAQYENEDTGVYFTIDYYPNTSDAEEAPLPAGFRDVGLCFSLNYIRPSFFALEAMPFVELLTRRFELLVCDPQDHEIGGSGLPKRCDVEELLTSWKRSNAWAIRGHQQSGGQILSFPESESRLWWEYSKNKQRLQEEVGSSIFVPSIMFVKRRTGEDLYTMITWTQAIPQIVPKCDFILVQREKRSPFRLAKREEVGIVSYQNLISQVGQYLDQFEGPIPGLRILNPSKAGAVSAVFNSIALEDVGDFEGVPSDGFIDSTA